MARPQGLPNCSAGCWPPVRSASARAHGGGVGLLCSLAVMADADQVPSELADETEPPALTQQERAEATLRSIMSGGNLTAETMKLSNEFTDRHVSRLKALFRRSP